MSPDRPKGPPPGPDERPVGPPPGPKKRPSKPPPPAEPTGPTPSAKPAGPPPSADAGAAAAPPEKPPPSAPPTAGPPAPRPRKPRRWGRRIAWSLVLLGVVGGWAYVAFRTDLLDRFTGGGDTTTVASEVLLEAKANPGPDPFTPPVDNLVVDPVVAPPEDGEALGAVAVSLDGREVGLYGGTGDDQLCDQAQMVAFLETDTAKQAAWAQVQAIDPGAVSGYVGALTPAILNLDTRVTNHGFAGGAATPRQSVLEAGTAVLVDAHGTPRARCRCGNPLLPPQATTGEVSYTGAAWDGFDPTALVAPPGTAAAALPDDTPAVQPSEVVTGGGTGTPPAGDGPNLIVGGGFDSALEAPWGTGIYEPREELFWGAAAAGLAIDTSDQVAGASSLLVTNTSPLEPQVYRTVSQRVSVDPSVTHCLSVWARVEPGSEQGIALFTVDDAWTTRLYIPPQSSEWTVHSLEFVPEDGDIDVRLITEAPGAAWLDDLRLAPGPCAG